MCCPGYIHTWDRVPQVPHRKVELGDGRFDPPRDTYSPVRLSFHVSLLHRCWRTAEKRWRLHCLHAYIKAYVWFYSPDLGFPLLSSSFSVFLFLPPFPNSSTVSIPSQAELLETMSLSVVEYRTHAIQRAPALQLSRSGETSSKIWMGEAAVASGVFSISGGVAQCLQCTPHSSAKVVEGSLKLLCGRVEGDDEWRCKRNESSLVRARSETRGKEGFDRGKRKIMLRQEAAPKTVTVMATPVTVRQIVRHRYSDRAQPSM